MNQGSSDCHELQVRYKYRAIVVNSSLGHYVNTPQPSGSSALRQTRAGLSGILAEDGLYGMDEALTVPGCVHLLVRFPANFTYWVGTCSKIVRADRGYNP